MRNNLRRRRRRVRPRNERTRSRGAGTTHAALELSCPVIFFQGTEDKVVPPNQSEAMVEALREKNIPVAYVLFEGEGHGFRQAANVRQALENELSFYAQVFGFQATGEIERVEIESLSLWSRGSRDTK